MLSLIKAWECDIWPHALRLRLGKQTIARHERQPGEALDTALSQLFRQRPAAMPWRDSVTFNLDTDDLSLLVVPWQPGVATPQELLQLARLHLAQRAVSPAQKGTWLLRFESAAWQQPALVAAIPQLCQEKLQALARREQLRFRGIATPFQPLLKQAGRRLPATALFITLSDRQCRIASRIQHAWRDVSIFSLPPQERLARLQVITRLSGMPDCPHYIFNTEEGQPQRITSREERV